MDTQSYINLLLLAVSGLGSIVLSILGFAMVRIIGDIKELAKSINDLSLLVAGQYVTRSEHDKIMCEIFQKLDRIVERQK